MIYAHRGASRAERENTVAAFDAAVRAGADAVELDVRRTADDRLVVHHDASLPDGRAIRTVGAADLPGHVPTLDAALDACGALAVNIEIKNDPREPDFDPSDWVAVRLASSLRRRGGGPRWLISSFRLATVQRMRHLHPTVRTALLTTGCDRASIEWSVAAGCVAIHPAVDALDRTALLAAHGAGLAVNVWTCDDPGRLAELVAWGVDGICTNVPDIALAIRDGER